VKPDDLDTVRGIALAGIISLGIYAAVIAAVLALLKWWPW
jgi:uncharacterized membrane protein YeiB